ncbi:MAG: hypothetical protein KF812_03465 [Fimbriimonadaceae bacterium]|nr:hypothetical protein [Fimbriimonadaceae bacterium]
MSMDEPTEVWARSDIKMMLDLLPIMEQPGFRVVEWVKRTDIAPDDPFTHDRVYHPVIDRFWHLCYATSCYIAPYDPLPEDKTPEGIKFCTLGMSFAEDYFAAATLNQVRRYLLLITRSERFCDGFIQGEFECGKMLSAFRRVRELYEAEAK